MSAIDELTETQQDVLRLLARGTSVSEVALRLNRSRKSVESHKYRLMRALGVHDRLELARVAIHEGLIDVSTVLVSGEPPSVLSERQRDVLTLIARGLRLREVAGQLDISARAADAHKTRAMYRLGIHERIGVLYYAIRHGLIDVTWDAASAGERQE